MFVSAKQTYGGLLVGSDGRAGSIQDLLIDDRTWRVRHLTIGVDRWFLGRQVLLDPGSIERADWPSRQLYVGMSKREVRRRPSIDADSPPESRDSAAAAQALVWEAYWTSLSEVSPELAADVHLHSARMLAGLRVRCPQGALGLLEDFWIDDQTWSVRDLELNARGWWSGHYARVEPASVEAIDWDGREIRLAMSREQFEHLPEAHCEGAAQESLAGRA